MHAKSDSEVTSIPASSPSRSPPRRPAYYVQSPARESHDGDSKFSSHSTPVLSPVNSPLHPGYARTRDSSHSYSRSRDCAHSLGQGGRGKHGFRRLQPQPATQECWRTDKGAGGWSTCTVIEEEPQLRKPGTVSRIYKLMLLLLGCSIFLALFILFFWLVFKPGRPVISIKNVVFDTFNLGQGTDASGVPSQILTINSTVQIDYTNPSKYFTAHIDPLEVELGLSDVIVASGKVTGYSQAKKSRKIIPVIVRAVKMPLYGAANGQVMLKNNEASVSLRLTASLRSQFLVMGKMVKRRFGMIIYCNLVVNSVTMALSAPIRDACTYDPP